MFYLTTLVIALATLTGGFTGQMDDSLFAFLMNSTVAAAALFAMFMGSIDAELRHELSNRFAGFFYRGVIEVIGDVLPEKHRFDVLVKSSHGDLDSFNRVGGMLGFASTADFRVA